MISTPDVAVGDISETGNTSIGWHHWPVGEDQPCVLEITFILLLYLEIFVCLCVTAGGSCLTTPGSTSVFNLWAPSVPSCTSTSIRELTMALSPLKTGMRYPGSSMPGCLTLMMLTGERWNTRSRTGTGDPGCSQRHYIVGLLQTQQERPWVKTISLHGDSRTLHLSRMSRSESGKKDWDSQRKERFLEW